MALLLLFIFDSIKTIYNVTATTEIISFHSSQKPSSRINLFDADIYTLKALKNSWQSEEVLVEKSFSGSVEIYDSTTVKIERIGNGPLLIELVRPQGGRVASLRGSNTQGQKLTSIDEIMFIEIHNIDSLVNNNISVVIPLSGEIILGKSIEVESNNEYSLLLQEGDITMTGYTKFGKKYFVAGQEKLYLGDKLIFDDKNSIGIATVNTKPAIQVSYRAVGEQAKIIKPGPRDSESGYTFAASTFSRFKYDSFFQGLSILAGFLLFVLKIWDTFSKVQQSKN